MRRIIVISMITLDGVMQAPGGPEEDVEGGFEFGGWTAPYQDEVGGKVFEKSFGFFSSTAFCRACTSGLLASV